MFLTNLTEEEISHLNPSAQTMIATMRKMETLLGRSIYESVTTEEFNLRDWLMSQPARVEDALDYLLDLKQRSQPMPWQPGYQDRLNAWLFARATKQEDPDASRTGS